MRNVAGGQKTFFCSDENIVQFFKRYLYLKKTYNLTKPLRNPYLFKFIGRKLTKDEKTAAEKKNKCFGSFQKSAIGLIFHLKY